MFLTAAWSFLFNNNVRSFPHDGACITFINCDGGWLILLDLIRAILLSCGCHYSLETLVWPRCSPLWLNLYPSRWLHFAMLATDIVKWWLNDTHTNAWLRFLKTSFLLRLSFWICVMCSWHDKAMLFEQHHWKKALKKNKDYEFKVLDAS